MRDRSHERRWSIPHPARRPQVDRAGLRIAVGNADDDAVKWEAAIVVYRGPIEPIVELEFTRRPHGVPIVRRCAVDDAMFEDLFSEDPERCVQAITRALDRARRVGGQA